MANNIKNKQGDTIIEVLIAIAIAGFAIAISYATAHRSLQQAITSGERSQALNFMENQIADLKLRYQNTPSASFATFTNPSANHFCLDDTATTSTNPLTWNPYTNLNNASLLNTNLASAAVPSNGAPYSNKCHKQNGGADYYLDINTFQAAGVTQFPTVYQVNVRWQRLGGGQTNHASIFYRF